MDQQKWMDLVSCHGSSMLNAVVGNFTNSDSDDDTYEQVLFEVLKKRHDDVHKLSGPKLKNCLLKPDPVIPMPPELYRRQCSLTKRRQLFFKHLKRYDILYLQVINSDNEESYKCLVLAKHGDVMKIDDLSIVAHFPKLEPELEFVKEGLYKFDLIRGALWSCSVWERKLFITLDSRIFDKKEKEEELPKLGKITRKDLPYYVGSEKVGMTYAGYVQRSPGYIHEGYCMKQLRECLGIDTNRIYSFFKEWDGKTYPESECIEELKKKLIPDPSTEKLYKSFEYFRAGNMYKALYYSNKAIMHNPDNIQARVTRGTIFANLGKMKKAFIDTEDCLKLDPAHEGAKKQMSELLVSASKVNLCEGKHLKWHEALTLAKKYNPNNREAEALLAKSTYETPISDESAPNPVMLLIPPSLEDVAPIYDRVFRQADRKRMLKQFKKMSKQKRKRRRHRSGRHKSHREVFAIPIIGQSGPSTSRRVVSRRASSPVFRRPFPPRPLQ